MYIRAQSESRVINSLEKNFHTRVDFSGLGHEESWSRAGLRNVLYPGYGKIFALCASY